MTRPRAPKRADLVLSGGGVKGIGLVGAVVALMDAGYVAERVSGTSAGSIVGAIVAAASQGHQLTGAEVKQLALSLDYGKFLDPGLVERVPLIGPSLAVARGSGIYRGDYAHEWVSSQLKALVAEAVRASMSIPFIFRPVTLTSTTGLTSTLVDGGILSNFPIDSLDRADGKKPRCPTFGVTVLPNLPEGNDRVIPALSPLRVIGPPHLLEEVITTVLVGRDQAYLNQPWVSARAIRVDSTEVGFLDFDISDNQVQALYQKGYDAAETFLTTWDWRMYLREYR